MRDLLEQLLRAAPEPDPGRADALWADYRDRGDEPAFATLLAWYGPRLYRRAWGFLRDHAAAEDAFQSAIGKLHAHRARLSTFHDAVLWWRAVVLNEVRQILRARARRRVREARAAVPEASDVTAARELQESLRDALDRLPADQREAVALVYFEGLTRQDAAAALGVNRDTLAKRLDRALDRLRTALGAAGALGAVAASTADAALTATATVSSAARLAELAVAGMKRASAAGVGWAKKAIVFLAVTTVGGVAAGAWLWPPPPPGPQGERSGHSAPADPIETVPERNLRVLRAAVLPKVRQELRGWALGDGEVEVLSAEAYDTRVYCVLLLRHKIDEHSFASRMMLTHDTRERWTRVEFDMFGNGAYRRIDPTRPLVLWRNPINGKEWVVQSGTLTRAVAAFAALPRDDRTEAEFAAHQRHLDAATEPFLGAWYDRGNPARRYAVRRIPAQSGGVPVLEFVNPTGERAGFGYDWLTFDAEGRLCFKVFGLSRPELSPDGRRIDFPPSGDWWARDPITDR